MKNFILMLIVFLLIVLCSGCTVQFKAKEIELDGHVYESYEFERFAWTNPEPEFF